MNLLEDIDRDLARTPQDSFDLAATLKQGRTAVRRRRVLNVTSGAAASVVLIGGLVTALDASAPTPARDIPVASQEQADSCETTLVDSSGAPCDAQVYLDGDKNVTYTPQGELVVRDGWTITDRVDDPIASVDAIAVSVTDGTDSQWALIEYPRANGDVFLEYVDPHDFPGATFRTWLDYATSLWLGKATSAVVTYTDDGDLVAKPGWSIRRQATGLTMPSGYKGPAGVTAVVQLEQASGWFLVRPTSQGAEAFPLLAVHTKIEEILDYVASPRYVPGQQGFVRPTP